MLLALKTIWSAFGQNWWQTPSTHCVFYVYCANIWQEAEFSRRGELERGTLEIA